jgi:hypothetical protein
MKTIAIDEDFNNQKNLVLEKNKYDLFLKDLSNEVNIQ